MHHYNGSIIICHLPLSLLFCTRYHAFPPSIIFALAAALVCACCSLIDAALVDSRAMEEEDQLKRIEKLLLKILPFSYAIALEGGCWNYLHRIKCERTRNLRTAAHRYISDR